MIRGRHTLADLRRKHPHPVNFGYRREIVAALSWSSRRLEILATRERRWVRVKDFMAKFLWTALRQLEMTMPMVCLIDEELHVVEPRPEDPTQ